MRACREGRSGEVSARSRAAALGHAYLGLKGEGRKRFLQVMATEFDTDHAAVDAAVKELQSVSDPVARQKAEQALKKSVEAARVRLLTQFNVLPEGVKFLVDLRADLTDWTKDDPVLQPVETTLKCCCLPGLMSGSWSLSRSPGMRRRRCWKSCLPARPCKRSKAGTT